MKVFISYSTGDLNTVREIEKAFEQHVEVRYWHKSQKPGQDAWKSICEWIIWCDTMIVVITDKTVTRAMSVGQEIGHAKEQRKQIIPLVAEGVPQEELGCLAGITYVTLSPTNPTPALEKLKELFPAPKKELASRKKEASGGLGDLVLVSVLVGLVWLVFFKKEK